MGLVLTCPACGKRLNIPDRLFESRIRGRVVTIGCKNCQSDIQVDGTVAGADADAECSAARLEQQLVPRDSSGPEIAAAPASPPSAAPEEKEDQEEGTEQLHQEPTEVAAPGPCPALEATSIALPEPDASLDSPRPQREIARAPTPRGLAIEALRRGLCATGSQLVRTPARSSRPFSAAVSLPGSSVPEQPRGADRASEKPSIGPRPANAALVPPTDVFVKVTISEVRAITNNRSQPRAAEAMPGLGVESGAAVREVAGAAARAISAGDPFQRGEPDRADAKAAGASRSALPETGWLPSVGQIRPPQPTLIGIDDGHRMAQRGSEGPVSVRDPQLALPLPELSAISDSEWFEELAGSGCLQGADSMEEGPSPSSGCPVAVEPMGAKPSLAPVAMAAPDKLGRWRYRPYVEDGRAVPFCYSLRYQIGAR
jgi:hypothetical protein